MYSGQVSQNVEMSRKLLGTFKLKEIRCEVKK